MAKTRSQAAAGSPKRPSAGSNKSASYIDMSGHEMGWRLINLAVGAFCFLRGLVQIGDPDWWLWAPSYTLGCFMTLCVAACPKIVNAKFWRYTCASVIVFGAVYLAFTTWIVREVAFFSYLQNPTELVEGKECGLLALLILWAILCRMTAENIASKLLHIRLLLFAAIIIGCVPVVAWSLCFYGIGLKSLPYCRHTFITGCSD